MGSTRTEKKSIKPAPVKKPVIFSFSFKMKCQILAILGFVFYINSVGNKYAMDDSIAIERNTFVRNGIPGIPKILTTDSYYSFYTNMGADPTQQLKGGRYRPLSEIIFAIDESLFGWLDAKTPGKTDEESTYNLAHLMHFINVIAYIFCLLVIFYFLDKFLLSTISGGSDIAFLSTVLFAIHPLHTEVVANIKSLDEIISITLIMFTFIFSILYVRQRKTKHLILGCVFYLLALLAKEYAVTLIFFIPLLIYLLEKKKIGDIIFATLPFLGILVVYIAIRLNAVGFHSKTIGSSDILSNPYLYATATQKLATEWYVMGKYLKLLFIPYPLSADYSYYQIKYTNFSDITVILSILIYIGLSIWGCILILQKNILAFPVFFFLLNLFMVSNLMLDIGATMGERLAFHSSLGFVIILSYYFVKGLNKLELKQKKVAVFSIVSVLSVVCLAEVVVRNTEWTEDTVLFIHDVNVVPNSCLVNNNAGFGYISMCEDAYKGLNNTDPKKDLDSAVKYSKRALIYNKDYVSCYLNLGAIYFHKQNPDSALYYWNIVNKLFPNHPSIPKKYALLAPIFYQRGMDKGKNGDAYGGLKDLKLASTLTDTSADIWYNLGGAYYTIKKYDSARYAWLKALKLKPNDQNVIGGLNAIEQLKKQTNN